MIDNFDDAASQASAQVTYITLSQAAASLPRRRRGRKTHVSTLYRWTASGCRGVKLRSVQIGATRCTTREWLAEFFATLTVASERAGNSPGEVHADQRAVRSAAARSKADDRAALKMGPDGKREVQGVTRRTFSHALRTADGETSEPAS
jgi:hypothetical protein